MQQMNSRLTKGNLPGGMLRRINQHSPWEENLVVSVLSLGEGGDSSY